MKGSLLVVNTWTSIFLFFFLLQRSGLNFNLDIHAQSPYLLIAIYTRGEKQFLLQMQLSWSIMLFSPNTGQDTSCRTNIHLHRPIAKLTEEMYTGTLPAYSMAYGHAHLRVVLNSRLSSCCVTFPQDFSPFTTNRKGDNKLKKNIPLSSAWWTNESTVVPYRRRDDWGSSITKSLILAWILRTLHDWRLQPRQPPIIA